MRRDASRARGCTNCTSSYEISLSTIASLVSVRTVGAGPSLPNVKRPANSRLKACQLGETGPLVAEHSLRKQTPPPTASMHGVRANRTTMINSRIHRNVSVTIASFASLLLSLACTKDPPASTTSTTGASTNEGTANTVNSPTGANAAQGAAPATTAPCASCPAPTDHDQMSHGQMGRMGAMNHGMGPHANPMPMPMPDGGHMP
jgi:hypothetical protein